MRIAWGVTGSGDKLTATYGVMRYLKDEYGEALIIHVYLSKAGEQVAKYYRLLEKLQDFDRFNVEVDSNTPFLSGMLQMHQYDFLLIAPATSNTVAKIVAGISDTLLTNAAIQAVKGYSPVYVMPVDFSEGEVITRTSSGKELRLLIRREDAENTRRLEKMFGFSVFENPDTIKEIIERRLRD